MSDEMRAWLEIVKIPTHKIGAPDKNPMFLEKWVSPGSSGLVDPHPVVDGVFDEKADKAFTFFFAPEGLEDDTHIAAEVDGQVYVVVEPGAEYSFKLSTAEGKTVRVTTLTRVEAEHARSC